MTEKILGILGGMGPEATVDFMQRIISLTPGKDDNDHIRMIVDNNPKVPSRIKALVDGTGENPAPYLVEMAQGLEKHGADFLVIPCNTAHYYYSEVSSAVNIPVLNMVELTVNKIVSNQPEIKRVGLLASTALLITGLFKETLKKRNITIQYPSENLQNRVMASIKKVKAGSFGQEQIKDVQSAGDFLIRNNAEVVIIGCTELSVIAKQINFNVDVYDSSQVLAETVVNMVKKEN